MKQGLICYNLRIECFTNDGQLKMWFNLVANSYTKNNLHIYKHAVPTTSIPKRHSLHEGTVSYILHPQTLPIAAFFIDKLMPIGQIAFVLYSLTHKP